MEKTIKSQQNTVKKATAKKPVKAKSNAAKDLRALFEDELKDMYGAEKALVKALPKMIQNANSKELAKAITNHLKVTEQQVKSVEAVFQAIGKKAQAKKCLAMEGLIKEAEELMKSAQEGDVRDAGIISASQKVEHYEIASYGTLCSFAKSLG
jgi:ferritin-like metal-binding protein YciE